MKKTFLALSMLAVLSGCRTAAVEDENSIAFGSSVTIEVKQSAVFEDGLVLTLVSIDDSRCAEGVQCIWEGDLSTVFEVSGTLNSQELRMGTSRTSTGSIENYRFSLDDADETSATVIVNKAE